MKKRLSMLIILCLLLVMAVSVIGKANSGADDVSLTVNILSNDINDTLVAQSILSEFTPDSGTERLYKNTKIIDGATNTATDDGEYVFADVLMINSDLFSDTQIINYAQKALKNNTIVYFYGAHIDYIEFCYQFDLKSALPTILEEDDDKGIIKSGYDIEHISELTKNLSYLGVFQAPFGNCILYGYDIDYDYSNAFKGILKSAYSLSDQIAEGSINTEIQSGGSTYYPVDFRQYNNIYFEVASWGLLTHVHLFRYYDQNPTYDYFYIQTKNEFDWDKYTQSPTVADGFWTWLQLRFNHDEYYDHGPKSTSSGSSSITVSAGLPPSLGLSYTYNVKDTGMRVTSAGSLSARCADFLYRKNYWFSFNQITQHESVLSFLSYAPSASYHRVDVDLYFQGRRSSDSNWFKATWSYPIRYRYNY